MKNKNYCITLIMLVSLSCRKISDTQAPFTSASYPLAVGNWWQYKFTDIFLGGGTDTFILSIDSMYTVGPYTKYACSYIANGMSAPAGYFLQSDTSMSFVNALNSYFVVFPNFYLKFPVEPGQYWQGSFPGDSTMVVGAVNSYSTYNHTYGPCYSIVERYDLPHNFKVERMLLTPKVGLITQSLDFNSDTALGGLQINQSITLISYHVQ